MLNWNDASRCGRFENSRYTLENMPERARDLHAQITDKLTAYVKENNLPYTKEGLQNSITALTAEAFDQKMTQVDLSVFITTSWQYIRMGGLSTISPK